MDFNTTHAAPVTVKINGTDYNVPRFLLPDIKAWAAEQRKAIQDAALAQLKDDADAKARFVSYFRPPPVDIGEFRAFAIGPDGIEYVIRRQLAKAGVPADVIDSLIANADPLQQQQLSDELCSAKTAETATAGTAATAGSDPLAGQGSTSTDAPSTGQTPPPSSEAPSVEATKAA